MPESFADICPTQPHQGERLEGSTGDGNVSSTVLPRRLPSANPRLHDVITVMYIVDYFENTMDSISENPAREKADPTGRTGAIHLLSLPDCNHGNRKFIRTRRCIQIGAMTRPRRNASTTTNIACLSYLPFPPMQEIAFWG